MNNYKAKCAWMSVSDQDSSFYEQMKVTRIASKQNLMLDCS